MGWSGRLLFLFFLHAPHRRCCLCNEVTPTEGASPFPLAFIPSISLYMWRIWSYGSPRRGRCCLMLASIRHSLWPSFDLKIFTIKSLTWELLQKVRVFGKVAKTRQSAKVAKSRQKSSNLVKIRQNSPSASFPKNPRLLALHLPLGMEGAGLGHHLGPPSPHSKLFLFCLVLHSYMWSGSFYRCKLFLLIQACILMLCSDPGMVTYCTAQKSASAAQQYVRNKWEPCLLASGGGGGGG